MDVRMPVMDGLAATKSIRVLPRNNALTVAIIDMTVDAGMNTHLLKLQQGEIALDFGEILFCINKLNSFRLVLFLGILKIE